MNNFDLIRPYTDKEVPEALQRIVESRLFPIFVRYFLNEDTDQMRQLFKDVNTVSEFQEEVMKPMLKRLMGRTTSRFTASGFTHLERKKPYLFISNHRDIVLDAAWLDVALSDEGIDLMEITFGSNLMSNQFNIDLGKINRMFKLVREGNRKELYKGLCEVSQYMRYVVSEKNSSVWIAQRNGRTKNGDDKTEVALLKMLAMSSDKGFVDNMSELRICPVAVSYEYEPCDFLKTMEVYVSQHHKYVKGKNEDAKSVKRGLQQFKGEVHFEVMKPIMIEELQQCEKNGEYDYYKSLANVIDKRIYSGYRLHKTNYIAYDILHNCRNFVELYSDVDRQHFEQYMNEGLTQLSMQEAWDDLRTIFLNIYAMPIVNAIKMRRR